MPVEIVLNILNCELTINTFSYTLVSTKLYAVYPLDELRCFAHDLRLES